MNPKPACTAPCCAGLIFGVSDASLLGQHLGRYVAMNGNAVSDLMDTLAPPLGAGGDEASKPKSNMKATRSERNVKQVGPVNTLHTRQVGGLPVELPITLQVVRKNWPASGTYLIIHAQAWPCGR